MRKLLTLPVLLALAACDGGPGSIIDGRALLDKLEGPKVPTVRDTLKEAAKESEKQGDYATAAQIYSQILEKNPEDKDIELALADCYRRAGEYDKAIFYYDDLIRKDPSLLGAKEGKGLALIEKGDFETPALLLDDVMKADPTRWKTLNGLGILFTTRNLHTEAQQYFREALRHSPSNIAIINNLGLSQALDRDFDKSIATLQQAGNMTSADSWERKRIDLNMALVYAISGRLEEARAIAEMYYTGAELNNNLGLYAHLANDDSLAKTYLNMALTQSKTFYEKAWENLQSINTQRAAPPAAKPKKPASKAKEEEPAKKNDPKPVASPVPKTEKPKAVEPEPAPAPKAADKKPEPKAADKPKPDEASKPVAKPAATAKPKPEPEKKAKPDNTVQENDQELFNILGVKPTPSDVEPVQAVSDSIAPVIAPTEERKAATPASDKGIADIIGATDDE